MIMRQEPFRAGWLDAMRGFHLRADAYPDYLRQHRYEEGRLVLALARAKGWPVAEPGPDWPSRDLARRLALIPVGERI